MSCNNCFEKGHYYKNCTKPLMSYGLCCYKNIDNEYFFLMVMRKNTYTYIEFIRGLYDILDYDYIKILFDKMTNEEKFKIKTENYKKLWNDIWMITNNDEIKNKTEFYKGIIKFNILKNGFYHNNKKYILDSFIDNSNNNYDTPEWYFPKGKRNPNEDIISTSLREFVEETNMIKDDIKIYKNYKFEEIHTSSNNKTYKTVFFLSEYYKNHDIIIENFNNKKNEFQLVEIGDIKWISLNNLNKYFRPYENSKKELIIQLKKHFESKK